MQRTKKSVRNISVSLIEKFIDLIIVFATRTIILKFLGTEYLGLNSLFNSILQMLNIAELGLGTAIIFSMYKPIANNDVEKTNALLNFYKKSYRIIGIVVLILGLIVMPFIRTFINGDIPEGINIYVVFFIYLVGTVSSYFVFAYKGTLLNVTQRLDIAKYVTIIMTIIKSTLQIIAVVLVKNYYYFVLVIPLITIAHNLFVAYIVKKLYPEFKPQGELEKEEKKEIQKHVKGLVINKICGMSRNAFDSIFLSAFLGLTQVAIYNNYFAIITAIKSITTLITTAITASVGNSIAIESVEKNHKDFLKFNFMFMWFVGIATVSLLCLFQPFMTLWMGEEYLFPFSVVCIITLYFYVMSIGEIRYLYQVAAGLFYEVRYVYIIETILNIILNYFLGKYFHAFGIVLATVITVFFVNYLGCGSIIFKKYFVGIKQSKYYLDQLLYFVTTIASCVLAYYICTFVNINPYVDIIIKGFISVLIPCIVYLLCYFKTDNFKESIQFLKYHFLKSK